MLFVYIYIYTCNPNDPCFDVKRPCFGGWVPPKIEVIWVPGMLYNPFEVSLLVVIFFVISLSIKSRIDHN